MSQNRKVRVLLVDDDQYTCDLNARALDVTKFHTQFCISIKEAIPLISSQRFDVAVLDVFLGSKEGLPPNFELHSSVPSGIALAEYIRLKSPRTKIIGLSQCPTEDYIKWFADARCTYCEKRHTTPARLDAIIKRRLEFADAAPRVFIVHGRDHNELFNLKTFCERTLLLGSVVSLSNSSSMGRTIIEKFEHYVTDLDVAFVMLTPDDFGHLAGEQSNPSLRPRMNVIFEWGYLLGALRRSTGRVIALRKGNLELPSDASGLIYIDITNGISSAEGEIRAELQNLI